MELSVFAPMAVVPPRQHLALSRLLRRCRGPAGRLTTSVVDLRVGRQDPFTSATRNIDVEACLDHKQRSGSPPMI